MTRDTFCLGSVVKTVKSESQLASLTTMILMMSEVGGEGNRISLNNNGGFQNFHVEKK